MIDYATGDLLEADREALVNSVNCVGVMGRGVALAFKRRFPANFRAYKAACDWGEVEPGRMFVFETDQLQPRYIINFPTKRHWRDRSRLGDIAAGLSALVAEIEQRHIRSIALPPLGCGLGGLEWSRVKPLIHAALAPLSGVDTLVFEPNATSASVPAPAAPTPPAITPGRAALLGLMHRYLAGLAEPFVTLLELHKLMYFMQEAGEPLSLRYEKEWYGPYAKNLRHVVDTLDGYYLTGEGAGGGDKPDQPLFLMPGATAKALAYLADYPESRARFDRVAELVEGFESPSGLELLATVHWVVTEIGSSSAREVTRATYAWNKRKRRFSKEHIVLARDRLRDRGWIESLSE